MQTSGDVTEMQSCGTGAVSRAAFEAHQEGRWQRGKNFSRRVACHSERHTAVPERRWRRTAESVACALFSIRNGAVTVANAVGLFSASIRSLMRESQAGVREIAKRTRPPYRPAGLIYIDGKNSLRLRANDESGSQTIPTSGFSQLFRLTEQRHLLVQTGQAAGISSRAAVR
jgi:phosphate/sulfate permease